MISRISLTQLNLCYQTPPRNRDISSTSSLSPSKYNAAVQGNPLKSSPLFIGHDGCASFMENIIKPNIAYLQHLDLPGCVSKERVANDTENIKPREGNTVAYPTLPCNDITEKGRLPDYVKLSVNDPVKRSASNVGRRRANAHTLMESPARQSHSQEMARLFERAQGTVLFQAETSKRPEEYDRTKATIISPPRRPTNVKPFKSPPRTAPVLQVTQIARPCLPELTHVGRLSDVIPADLQVKRSAWRTAQKSPRDVPIHKRVSRVPSQVIKSPRVRPFKSPEKQTAGTVSCSSESPEKLYPLGHVTRGEPDSELHVQNWLNKIDDTAAYLESTAVASPFSPTKAKSPSPVIPSSRSTSQPSRSSKLQPKPLRFKLPPLLDLHQSQLPKTPTLQQASKTRHRLRRRGSQVVSSRTSSSTSFILKASDARKGSSCGSDLAKEQDGWLRLPSTGPSHAGVSDRETYEPLIQPQVKSTQTNELPPLSPDVATYRKGQGPQKPRRPSYYDRDILDGVCGDPVGYC